jgi:hypothetical protein
LSHITSVATLIKSMLTSSILLMGSLAVDVGSVCGVALSGVAVVPQPTPSKISRKIVVSLIDMGV